MQFENISDSELVARIDLLVARERESTVEILFHLIEVQRRGIYRELGHSSMFDYCRRRLRYSESAASRRIRSARVLSDFPEIEPYLKSGELTLYSLSLIAGEYTKDDGWDLIKSVLGKSTREVEEILAVKKPVKKAPKERITPIALHTKPSAEATELLPLINSLAGFTTGAGCKSIPVDESEVELRHEFKFTGDRELFDMTTEARNLLSGKYPHGVSLETLFKEALKALLDKQCPKRRQKRRDERRARKKAKAKSPVVKPSKANESSRDIPIPIKDQVFIRDKGRCGYIAPDGTKCNCTHDLEVHHVRPYALGGLNDITNLKLVCRTHNILYAEKDFGREKMNRYRKG